MRNLGRGQPFRDWMRDYHRRWIRIARLFRRQPIRLQRTLVFIATVIPLLCLLRYFSIYANARNTTSPTLITSSNKKQYQSRHEPFDNVNFLEDAVSLKRLAKIESEAALRHRYVCQQQPLENHVHLLKFCGDFRRPKSGKKIIGLVEARNVEGTIYPFLAALSKTVDTVVILDDHSTDLSRNAIMLFNMRFANEQNNKPAVIVEALLNKTGDWVREELFDRQVLLKVGRQLGGTHFVLLDYDEYFSANCVNNGLLRKTILQLQPGHSLYLPWIEVWKTPRVQAVLADDANMNFLKRRQIVVFADDGRSQFTVKNSVAKMIQSNKLQRDGSIHVLRCPRTICPQPPRYDGSPLTKPWGNIKVLEQCKIVEMRFLNLNNVLLKSVWYEALGRVMGASDGTTAGKMVDMILARFNQYNHGGKGPNVDTDDIVPLTATNPEWFHGFDERIFDAHARVEMWRAEDIVRWVDQHGKAFFNELKVMHMLNINELRTAVEELVENDNAIAHHVPRHKSGSLILAIDDSSIPVLSSLLRNSTAVEVNLNDIEAEFESGSNAWTEQVVIERWRKSVMSAVSEGLQRGDGDSTSRVVFMCSSVQDVPLSLGLLEVARTELGHLNIQVVLSDRVDSKKTSPIFNQALTYSREIGSHIRLFDIPLCSFGSAMTLKWLQKRLGLSAGDGNASAISFAESVHLRYGQIAKFAPVARLVFSLNVGRSGSKYLADVLGTVNGPMISLHEVGCPHRECTKGGAMRMQTRDLRSSYDMRRDVKLPLIRDAIRQLVAGEQVDEKPFSESRTCECWEIARGEGGTDANFYEEGYVANWEHREVFEAGDKSGCAIHTNMDAVYAETNPNFKSWFYDVVLDEMPNVGYDVVVVVIRKYIAAVLKSLFETGFFSTRDGYTWMETAAGVNSRVNVEVLKDDGRLDAAEKLLSYVINAEAIFRHIVKTYGNDRKGKRVRFVGVKAEKMYGVDGIEALLPRIGLTGSDQTLQVAGQVRDKYGEGGRKRIGRISIKESQQRVHRLIHRCDGNDGGDDGVVAQLLSNWSYVEGFEYEHEHEQ